MTRERKNRADNKLKQSNQACIWFGDQIRLGPSLFSFILDPLYVCLRERVHPNFIFGWRDQERERMDGILPPLAATVIRRAHISYPSLLLSFSLYGCNSSSSLLPCPLAQPPRAAPRRPPSSIHTPRGRRGCPCTALRTCTAPARTEQQEEERTGRRGRDARSSDG